VALLAGVAIGAVIGIMLAPEKGAETRSTVKKLLKDWGSKLTDFSEEEADELTELKNTLKAEMNKKA
jgi:gas vesicle protein